MSKAKVLNLVLRHLTFVVFFWKNCGVKPAMSLRERNTVDE
jgi:hypothetical protein